MSRQGAFFKTIFDNYSFKEAILAELEEDISFFVRFLPGLLGFFLRYLVYKCLFKTIHSIPYIFPEVRFVYMRRISLGHNVVVNSNCYIYARGGIEIGDNVLISPNCAIVAGDHEIYETDPMNVIPSKNQKIAIESGCWVGANTVIRGGVTIAKGSVIGAGAVVTQDTEAYSINAGVPARKIGNRQKGKEDG